MSGAVLKWWEVYGSNSMFARVCTEGLGGGRIEVRVSWTDEQLTRNLHGIYICYFRVVGGDTQGGSCRQPSWVTHEQSRNN